jgi:hypothetical protein
MMIKSNTVAHNQGIEEIAELSTKIEKSAPLTAQNSNMPYNADLLAVFAQAADNYFMQVDKLINNTWQNLTFSDEIAGNYIRNCLLLQQENNDAYAKFATQENNAGHDITTGAMHNLKCLFSMHEQTIVDTMNYVAVPLLKQTLTYMEEDIQHIVKLSKKITSTEVLIG